MLAKALIYPIVIIGFFCLVACGQKGPLYIQEEQEIQSAQESETGKTEKLQEENREETVTEK